MKKPLVNPYLPSWEYVPDGEPHVFGDRLYLYGSHDRFNGKAYCENDYVLWSAPLSDLKDWHCHGIVYRRTQDPAYVPGKSHMWAPDCAKGADGRYYLYYGMDFTNRIAVAVSDRPEGPFSYYGEVRYPNSTRYGGRDGEFLRFDAAVLADDDGRIWLYTGFCPTDPWFQTVAKKIGATIDARGSQVVELLPDMLTVQGEPAFLLPGKENAAGTGFEGHEFYEASSIRKFNGKYYAVYSSLRSHELCYAVSDFPDRGFRYGGILHSNGGMIRDGMRATNYWGNNHGSVVQIGDAYYVFGHRQTNVAECSRQGVAERLQVENGRFLPAEMTSQGLYGKPLPLNVTYEAGIACVLYGKHGAVKTTKACRLRDPYITQTGRDREERPEQYVANVRNGCVIGYRYFDLTAARTVRIQYRGCACGTLLVCAFEQGDPIAQLSIKPFGKESVADVMNASGVSALFFRFEGAGLFHLISFIITERES